MKYFLKKKNIQDPSYQWRGVEFATPHISLKRYFMKSCLENYRRDLFGYCRMGPRSDLFKGINWNVITIKVREFLTTCSQRTLLTGSQVEGISVEGHINLTSSCHVPASLFSLEEAAKPVHSQAWCSLDLDVASAEVKHSHSSLSRAFFMCCQCAGKNDFKLLSAQLLVHASQSHSDKPVTTQRRPLEKSTRAGL